MKQDAQDYIAHVLGYGMAMGAWLFAPLAVWWMFRAFGFGPQLTLNSYLAVWFLLVCLHLLIARAAATGWASAANEWRSKIEHEVANEAFKKNVAEHRARRPDLN